MRFSRLHCLPRGPATLAVALLLRPLTAAAGAAVPAESGAGPLFIQEFQVRGVHQLSKLEVEDTVYPFLGPGRSKDDVDQARAALEKAYHDHGWQTVAVEVPPQEVKDGVVTLQVVEGTVGRLRVRDARYFSPAEIKSAAPSLAEGTVPNFNDVQHDIVALNQLPDRRITPSLRPGVIPGTVDVDLEVKDSLPLHGSVELNNRASANTTALRLNGSVSYANLWQLGHTLGLSFQVAPEKPSEAKVFSGYYLVHVPDVTALSLMLQGTKQDSNVSTIGGTAVNGRGTILGPRALVTLPGTKGFYHSLSLGFDYKHFDQNITVAGSQIVAPITYYPWTAQYSATWLGDGSSTDLNAGVTLHVRGLGSGSTAFNNSRYQADGGFIYFRGDLAHTRDLPAGFQAYGKVQGQLASAPLLSGEQFSAGGLGTVRGYYEGEVPGDSALAGTLELRGPSLAAWLGTPVNEARLYLFFDAAGLTLVNPLPGQQARFDLASYGIGGRIRLRDHFNGAFDLGVPLTAQGQTQPHDLRLTVRGWADF